MAMLKTMIITSLIVLLVSLIGDKLCAGMDTKRTTQQQNAQQRTTTGTAPLPTNLTEVPMPSNEQQLTPSSSGTSSVADETIGQQGQMPWHYQMPEAQFGQMPTENWHQIAGQINARQSLYNSHPTDQNWEQSLPMDWWWLKYAQQFAAAEQIYCPSNPPNWPQSHELFPQFAQQGMGGFDQFYQNDFQIQMDKAMQRQTETEQPINAFAPQFVQMSVEELQQMLIEQQKHMGEGAGTQNYYVYQAGQQQNDDAQLMQTLPVGEQWHLPEGQNDVVPLLEQWQQAIAQHMGGGGDQQFYHTDLGEASQMPTVGGGWHQMGGKWHGQMQVNAATAPHLQQLDNDYHHQQQQLHSKEALNNVMIRQKSAVFFDNPFVPSPQLSSPDTAAAFQSVRKQRPPLPPNSLPKKTNRSSHQQQFVAAQSDFSDKGKARKLLSKFEPGQSSAGQQMVAGDEQQKVAATTSNNTRLKTAADMQIMRIKAHLMDHVTHIVLMSLRSLQIASPDTFFDGTIQQIRNGHPLEMALGPPKMALAQKLSQMNVMEVAKGIKMHLLNDGETKNNRIFAEIIDQTMANCVAVFGKTALTNDSVDGDDHADGVMFIKLRSVVLFFFSRLFRKLAGFLNAPFMEEMAFCTSLADYKVLAHGWDWIFHFLTSAGQQLAQLDHHLAESAKQSENGAKTDTEQSAKRGFWDKNCTNFASGSGTKQQN
ncbi:hypothetical protein niasHT_022004 [Heterodera trifolii]|uniref:Uncharacterized protein n=1 Tax=Heterodera trifolii TaxID=157864 RepID=A0ABD2JNB6_9BILA